MRRALWGPLLCPALAMATCPSGQAPLCAVSCYCAPIPAAGLNDLGRLLENVGQMAASGLAGWLKLSRDTAAAGDVQAIPLDIRVQLEPYYDFQVLDGVRYKVGDPQQLDATTAMLQNPDVNAVTLVDIIVFRHAEDARDNVALWAHELKHVQQYQQWGIEEFAARYTRDYNAVEAPAYAIQAQVQQALKRSTVGLAP
ncbi:DUF4157 domain-containing protein [Pseudomonas sp. MAFF212428]|uniref:DUF4157 domain-containing protein n=1 Tax=Pseudomonas brassicae TaxID=2708063 RepID=A0A6B3NMG8_9PSED|nr:DUF4157 domain-containing protein [Pseudomonas brassicae]NER61394.1 DUF4157 domain-containing protein [Pseudomonas brassicae]NER64602.1 DUF4157 domain-containing protein [Pseudomonas brassicae]